VVKLAAGSNEPTALPFTGLDNPQHVAVDNAGNVYVTDQQPRVVRLAAGNNDQTVLPLADLKWPGAVAVDAAGDVYVIDNSGFGRVVKLAAA
jgi:serine/threonine-protein kinase